MCYKKRNMLSMSQYSDVIMGASLKSPASRLFTKPFVQAQIKENIKAPRLWPLWGEFTANRWIPFTRVSNAENVSIWWRHDITRSYNG